MSFGSSSFIGALILFVSASPAIAVQAIVAPGDKLIAQVMSPEGQIETLGTQGETRTPLGSLYKLYMFAYMTETDQPEVVYTCGGENPEEIFCCSRGESIDRSRALAKSCSPYFSFSRIGFRGQDWATFWKKRVQRAPGWLVDPQKLKPETVVSVREVLETLQAIRARFSKFDLIQSAAMGTVIFGTASNALKTWGSTLRVKTYTWRDSEVSSTGERVDELGFTGGFAGWLPDGSSIWVSRAGHGRDAFQKELKSLVSAHLQTRVAGCVRVRFFDRYPVLRITPDTERPIGPVNVEFKNGHQITFESDGKLQVKHSANGVLISAEMGTDEYVARVLDREVQATPIDAARAFAVAIRTFLLQNSREVAGCREIADSSHHQRVSPARPSAASLEVARWTNGLTLSGIKNLRYHSSQAAPNRMSWVQARDLAKNGYSMIEILKTSYPEGVLVFGEHQPAKCEPNAEAARWITQQSRRWRRHLLQETGFEEPSELKVCKSLPGSRARPVYANLSSQEIYVPRVLTHHDEISVLHEYLHIGFRNHPRGRNEAYVENLANLLQETK